MITAREIKQLVARMVRAAFADVRTHIPAQVTAYDATTNTCKCVPVIKKLRFADANNLTTVSAPELKDVPVMQRGGGKLWDTAAPQVGSYGVLHVSDRVLEGWLSAGGIVDPTSMRQFDLSDAIFEPGILPLKTDGDNGALAEPVKTDRISKRTRSGLTEISVLDDESVFINVNDGAATVTIGADGAVAITTASDLSATADGAVTVESGGDAVVTNGSHTVTVGAASVDADNGSDFVAMAAKVDLLWTTLYTLLTTWTPVAMDGGAAFKAASVAAFPSPPSSVASTNLKAD